LIQSRKAGISVALAGRISWDSSCDPAILVRRMQHRPRPPEQNDLFRPRLVDMIDLRHELVALASLIDWDFFEREWAGFFPSTTGRPATSPRLVAGLLYLQHAFRPSDEAVVARWVEIRITSILPARRSFSTNPRSNRPRSAPWS
jgi:hypothetical protein